MPVTHLPRNGLIDVTFTRPQLKALSISVAGLKVPADQRDTLYEAMGKIFDAMDALTAAEGENQP